MSTLTEFLRARINEDLDEVGGFRRIEDWHEGGPTWQISGSPEYRTCYISPERLHAETDMKRALLARHENHGTAENPCTTLRLLAQPYKTHPDYRTEWD